jgi:2-polyprenyl-6-methoxyphenol hydroxylase-like FAD-dependent oxidoreductase
VDRNFAAIIAYAAKGMPEGSLATVEQAGPIGYFSSSDTWASKVAGNDVVLIGDAAGSPDPCQGHGTPLLFHDVRLLSELLTTAPQSDWEPATAAFAQQRTRIFNVVHAFDRWHDPFFELSDSAARLREGHERARQADPTLGGFAHIECLGPYGLSGNDDARRHYFGEDL